MVFNLINPIHYGAYSIWDFDNHSIQVHAPKPTKALQLSDALAHFERVAPYVELLDSLTDTNSCNGTTSSGPSHSSPWYSPQVDEYTIWSTLSRVSARLLKTVDDSSCFSSLPNEGFLYEEGNVANCIDSWGSQMLPSDLILTLEGESDELYMRYSTEVYSDETSSNVNEGIDLEEACQLLPSDLIRCICISTHDTPALDKGGVERLSTPASENSNISSERRLILPSISPQSHPSPNLSSTLEGTDSAPRTSPLSTLFLQNSFPWSPYSALYAGFRPIASFKSPVMSSLTESTPHYFAPPLFTGPVADTHIDQERLFNAPQPLT